MLNGSSSESDPRLCENADVYGSTGAISGPARSVLCADGFHRSANVQNAHHAFHVVRQDVHLVGFRSSRACTVSRTASCSQRENRRSLVVLHLLVRCEVFPV
jgi:hypothetical protein